MSCDGGVNSIIYYANSDCTSAIGVLYHQSNYCSSNKIYSCLASSSPYIFNYTSFAMGGSVYQYPLHTDEVSYIMVFTYSNSACTDTAVTIQLIAVNTCISNGGGTYLYISYGLFSNSSAYLNYYTANTADCSNKVSEGSFQPNTCFNGFGSYMNINVTYYAPGSLSTPYNEGYAGKISTHSSTGTITTINYLSLNKCIMNDSSSSDTMSYTMVCVKGKTSTNNNLL
jgi:hypothetical protein